MRIIGGKLRGKKLFFLKNKITRPLRDFVKESVFNIIQHSSKINFSIKDSNILDLYSGIGSFGLECISRDAGKVTFVEKDKLSQEMLLKNLQNLNIENKSHVSNNSVNSFINKVKNNRYDLIFLDPPFADDHYKEDLSLIKKLQIYSKKHLIIIHRESTKTEEFDKCLHIVEIKNYGRSKIIFGSFD